jgi:PadR family transcriptional regulator, regulatory protein AphA
MELSPTAHVILGMLGFEPMSGYEIKRFVDSSTRFFWAASYGQIYPELRRLANAGLIAGSDDPRGERRRTVYSLTGDGRAALRRWLARPGGVQEVRDESLLKLFFSEVEGPEATRRALEAKRDHHRAVGARLKEIEAGKADHSPESSTYITLRFGIAFNDFIAEWCAAEIGRLPAPAGKRRKAA